MAGVIAAAVLAAGMLFNWFGEMRVLNDDVDEQKRIEQRYLIPQTDMKTEEQPYGTVQENPGCN